MSLCRVFSCVVGRGCLLWPVHSIGKTLLAFALLHSVLQGQICLLLQVLLPTFAFQSSIMKGHIFGVLVLKGLVGLHRTVQLQLLQGYCLGHILDYRDIEWFALETNRDLSVVFEITSKYYCISDFFCWLWCLLHFFWGILAGPIISWQIDGETIETVRDFIFWAPKSLQMVTVAMKLKDDYSFEENLWPT